MCVYTTYMLCVCLSVLHAEELLHSLKKTRLWALGDYYIKFRQCHICGINLNYNVIAQWCFYFIQCENASLKEQMESVSKELEITKEKLHTIEQAWEQETKLGKYYDS